MTEDDLPRPKPDSALVGLAREDLDRLSVEELHARIAALRAEIIRTEARLAADSSVRSAADALFRRG